MSTRRKDYEATFEIHAGSEKSFELTIVDPDTGAPKDLSDGTLYDSLRIKVYKPGGNIIGTLPGSYDDRANGIILFTIPTTISTNENAGNWIGNIEFLNNGGDIIDQQFFGVNILESY